MQGGTFTQYKVSGERWIVFPLRGVWDLIAVCFYTVISAALPCCLQTVQLQIAAGHVYLIGLKLNVCGVTEHYKIKHWFIYFATVWNSDIKILPTLIRMLPWQSPLLSNYRLLLSLLHSGFPLGAHHELSSVSLPRSQVICCTGHSRWYLCPTEQHCLGWKRCLWVTTALYLKPYPYSPENKSISTFHKAE